jgi:hypothetical protein
VLKKLPTKKSCVSQKSLPLNLLLTPHLVTYLSTITSVADLKTDANKSGFEFVRPDGRKGGLSSFSVSIDTKYKKQSGVAPGMSTLRTGYSPSAEAAAEFLVKCIKAWYQDNDSPHHIPVVAPVSHGSGYRAARGRRCGGGLESHSATRKVYSGAQQPATLALQM